MKNILLVTIFILFFSSCMPKEQKELTISTNSWIGYTPLFYAQEKGYLKDINIKIITNVSLAEAAELYDIGKADMVTTTQHEYYSIKRSGHDIVPVILFDRSYGGDMILSNKTIKELQEAQKIVAYLEIDSINAEILRDFIRFYHIDENKIEFINKDQAQIEDLQIQQDQNMLIVTYVPYNITLQKHGFKEIASTQESDAIMVIDALCTSSNIIGKNKERLKKLKKIIDRSIAEIHNDTKKSYELVKHYLGDISYDEYLDSLKLIQWINRPSQELLKHIKTIGYDERDLIL